MKTYVFDLSGKMAHWRKFYTNSSSLSYYYPTRTQIIGIIASILEMERDSYYNLFKIENLNVGIEIISKVTKKINVLNYQVGIGRTQIKLETIRPIKDKIKYRIYLKSENNEEIEKILKKLEQKVIENKLGYGVYLGQRQFKGFFEFIKKIDLKKIDKCNFCNSILPKKNLNFQEEDFEEKNQRNLQYNIDIIPIDFNENRTIKKSLEVVCELENFKIKTENNILDLYVDEISNKTICFLR